jgi:predicted amidohydrolase YtcJ
MPDLILYNARIKTLEAGEPAAEAAAIRNGKILALGSTSAMRELATSTTRQVDLGRSVVLPGLHDSHVHFYDWSLGRSQLTLADTRSKDEMAARVANRAASTREGSWILGQGWNETAWDRADLPDKEDLDRAAPYHPVLLWRNDLHLAVANSLALRTAGIDQHTRPPADGVIDRGEDGSPTGILRELAINLIMRVIPDPSPAEIEAAMIAGGQELHRSGLTGLHDFRLMGGPESVPAFSALQRLRQDEQLPLRVWMNLPGERLEEAVRLGLRTGFGDAFLRVGHVKFFSDGGQGARTAWMLEPYEDTGTVGMPLTPMPELETALRLADAAGLAVSIHAIGDRANRELIGLFERVLGERKPGSTLPAAPHRIEHVQNARPEDVERLGKLGVFASVQPIHATDDLPMVECSVGARGRFAYAFRSLLDAGVPLALGSDAPVADPNPFWGIHAAVTRQRRDGSPPQGWYPEQRLSVEEAVMGYTLGPAQITGRQAELGSLAPGKYADMTVIDRDIFAIEPHLIADTRVLMTVVDGQIVFEA